MARCITVTFLLSGVLLAGLFYMFYSPLPPHLANRCQLQKSNAKLKVLFIIAEVRYQLGLSNDRMSGARAALEYAYRAPLTEDDEAMLEIYDTELNGVSVRIYKPKSSEGHLAGLVYYHGGGWVLGNVHRGMPSNPPTDRMVIAITNAIYDGICAHMARKANTVVISVEYRLAPEFPFPAGFDDCLQVALYALKNGDKINLDTKRIAVGGDSAGGNLAAAVAMKLRDDKVQPALKAQLIIYGVHQACDVTLPSYNLYEAYQPGDWKMLIYFLRLYVNLTETQTNLMFDKKYLTPEMQKKCDKTVDYKLLSKDVFSGKHVRPDRLATTVNDDVKRINSVIGDPRIAPMMADDLKDLPSAFVLAAEWDYLRDENLIYAERLKLAGNKVNLLYLPDSFHGILNMFDHEMYGFDAGPVTMDAIVAFLNDELK